MATYYSNDAFGRPVLSQINAAQVAQQDADTRKRALDIQLLQAMINAGVQRGATDSRERTANRGYQSEDLRSLSGLQGVQYGADANREGVLDTNRVRQYGIDTEWPARIQIAEKELEAASEASKAAAAQRLKEIEMRQGGLNAAGLREFSALDQLDQQRQDDENKRVADEINGYKASWMHIPGLGGKMTEYNANFDSKIAKADPTGTRFNVTLDQDGFKKVFPKVNVRTPEEVVRRYYRSIGQTPPGTDYGPPAPIIVNPGSGNPAAGNPAAPVVTTNLVPPPAPFELNSTPGISLPPGAENMTFSFPRYGGPTTPSPAASVVPQPIKIATPPPAPLPTTREGMLGLVDFNDPINQVYNAERDPDGSIVLWSPTGQRATAPTEAIALQHITRRGYTTNRPPPSLIPASAFGAGSPIGRP